MQPSQYKRSEARELCKTDPIFLGRALGYDILEAASRDVRRDGVPEAEEIGAVAPRSLQDIVCCRADSTGYFERPRQRILVMQATLKLTKGVGFRNKSHFDGRNIKSKLPAIFPEFCGRALGDAYSFTVPARTRKHLKEATVTAASPRAVQTGQHYTKMRLTILVNANNFRNVELLDKLESEFTTSCRCSIQAAKCS
jgi:hypothetical protein